MPLTIISIGNPKTQIKSPRKNEFLRFVSSVKLVAFFWNFGLHVDKTLSVKFYIQKFPNHGMCNNVNNAMAYIKPEIIRMSYRNKTTHTGNEINKAYSNLNIDFWTREFVFFCDTFEFGAAFCRLSRERLHLSTSATRNLFYTLRVAEVYNAKGRSLKMFKWM